jgi:copper(I)-binding protein
MDIQRLSSSLVYDSGQWPVERGLMNRPEKTMRPTSFLAAFALCGTLCTAQAATTVADAWVRGTVPQQQASGAFMRITSAEGGKLVAVTSPVAATVEVHEMKMDGGVMKMGAVPSLDLPAGQAVELKPGGYHVMLMGLKQQLKAGDQVPLTLTVEGKGGQKETLQVTAPVKALGQ